MRYSDLVGEVLKDLGYTHCFFVAGGGIMHLLDAFRTRFVCIPVVHEQSAGICAEHFNETSPEKQRAFVLVTTGPGLTNVVTAIAGCYVEHRELLVIAGQVKSTDLLKSPERQRGVQEVDGIAVCRHITVSSSRLLQPIAIQMLRQIVTRGKYPHPGPVLIEICLDVQGANFETNKEDNATPESSETPLNPDREHIFQVRDLIRDSNRPLFLLGGLVSRKAAVALKSILEHLAIPVATTTSAIDRIPSLSPIFAGRPGTWGGQRAANLIVAQADVLIAIGAQLDLQQTGFNYEEYSSNAKLIHVFPSLAELNRVGPRAYLKILADPDLFLLELTKIIEWNDNIGWLNYVNNLRAKVPNFEIFNRTSGEFINSFEFLSNLSSASEPEDILVLCSSGGTFTGSLQMYDIKDKQVATTSAAHASMGYGLASAAGAAFANPSRRVILTEGEGGFSQNLQELALLKRHQLNIKMFIFDNNGYASIRATQRKFFKGDYIGCDPNTGLDFPDWIKLFGAYNIPCRYLMQSENNPDCIRMLLSQTSGPEAWIISVDPEQSNWPAVATRLTEDGSLKSEPIYRMLPELPPDILKSVGKYLPEYLNELKSN